MDFNLVILWILIVTLHQWDPEKLSKLFFANEWRHALASNLLRLLTIHQSYHNFAQLRRDYWEPSDKVDTINHYQGQSIRVWLQCINLYTNLGWEGDLVLTLTSSESLRLKYQMISDIHIMLLYRFIATFETCWKFKFSTWVRFLSWIFCKIRMSRLGVISRMCTNMNVHEVTKIQTGSDKSINTWFDVTWCLLM